MRPSLLTLVLLEHVLLACALQGLHGPGLQFLAAWGLLASLVGFAGAVGRVLGGAP